MLKYSLILFITLDSLFSTFGDEYDDYESSAEMENIKITDVLKMIVLPPANEIKDIVTSGNNTKPPDSSKLDFILQAIEYWRKHNMEETMEENLGNDNNATKFTFNLRDDFFDKDGSTYSHLSKKIQSKRNSGSNLAQTKTNNKNRTRRSHGKVFIPLPYVFVNNFYVNDKARKDNKNRSSFVRKRQ